MTHVFWNEESCTKKEEYFDFMGERTRIYPYKSQIKVENASVLASFDDGTPAIQRVEYGKGRIYISGASIGYALLNVWVSRSGKSSLTE